MRHSLKKKSPVLLGVAKKKQQSVSQKGFCLRLFVFLGNNNKSFDFSILFGFLIVDQLLQLWGHGMKSPTKE